MSAPRAPADFIAAEALEWQEIVESSGVQVN
jgi:hypothetical protein